MKTSIIKAGLKEAGRKDDQDSYNELNSYSEDYDELTILDVLKFQGIESNVFVDLASFHCAKGKQTDSSSGSYRTFKSDIRNKWLDTKIGEFNNEKNPIESRNRIIIISQICGFFGVDSCNTFLSRYARLSKLDPKNYSDFVWIYLIHKVEKEGIHNDTGLLVSYTSLYESCKNSFSSTVGKSSIKTSVLLAEAVDVEDYIGFQEYLHKHHVEFKRRHDDMKNYIQKYISKYNLGSVNSALRLGDPCNNLEIEDESQRSFKQQSKNGIQQYEVYISKDSIVQRDKIIEIGLLMLMDLEELNGLLKAVNMDELYAKSSEGKLIYYLSKKLRENEMSSKKDLSDYLEKNGVSIFEELDYEFFEEDYYQVKVCNPRYFVCTNKTILCFIDEKGYKYKIEVTEKNMDVLMFLSEGDPLKINKNNRKLNAVLEVERVE